jgi:hypothetical protein
LFSIPKPSHFLSTGKFDRWPQNECHRLLILPISIF